MIDYSLYLVTDDPSRYAGDWIGNVLSAVDGGVTCVQYRDTESDGATRLKRARRLHDALRARGVPMVVNNDVRLAAALGAEGVHVGQSDTSPAEARAIVGARCEIGLSITARDQVDRIPAGLVSCVGIGPVYDARRTKADAAAAVGTARLGEIVCALPASVRSVAIGGITLGNAACVLETKVGGLAAVSAFSKAEDPYEAARRFAVLLDNRRK